MTPPKWRRLQTFLLGILVLLALGASTLLISDDVIPLVAQRLAHAPISAVPLLLIGITYLLMQSGFRPVGRELAQALLVSAAFISWGIYQLLPTGTFATLLGDLVITMYVVDLGLSILGQLHRVTPLRLRHTDVPLLLVRHPIADATVRAMPQSDASRPRASHANRNCQHSTEHCCNCQQCSAVEHHC